MYLFISTGCSFQCYTSPTSCAVAGMFAKHSWAYFIVSKFLKWEDKRVPRCEEYGLKKLSFESKECTKELKLECAYDLG